jgi:protein-S-isoprenylcysteine O-methyltransferase Ste14
VVRKSTAISTCSSAYLTAGKADETQLSSPTWRAIIVLDVVERMVFTAIFARFAVSTIENLVAAPRIETFLLLLSETLPCALILFRKPSRALSTRPTDWIFGVAGSLAPLLVTPAAVDLLVPEALCLALILGGLCTQIAAKIVLGRSFGVVAANRGVKLDGPYRLVRHPMYAGYTTTHIGVLLAMPSLLNAALYALAFAFQVIRILREEAILMQSQEYRDFAARVRYRLLPGIF